MTDINKLKEIEKLINVKFRKSSFTDYSYDYGEFVTSSFEGAPFQYWSWAAEPTYKYSVNDQGNIIGLCITRHGITEILEPILELKNIEYLNLSYNYIKDISLLVHFHKLKELVLFNNPIINYHKLIYHRLPKPLIVLLVETKRKINFNKIHFDDLSNKINCYSVNGLNELTGLRISEVGSLPVIRLLPYYKYLKHLALLNGEIKNIEPIQVISELQYLNLNNNKITDIQSIKGLKALRYLNLGNNQISNIDPISKLINLEYLVINNNSIENVNQLGHLSRLRVLICKNNRLKSFKSFYSLFKNEDFYIDAKPNPLEEPPLDILTQGNLAVLDWLDSVKAIANEVKLIFAGNTTTGKTSLAKFLVNSEYESLTDSTHGINISKWIINDLNINIWDLGGQEYYHSTHRLFMSDNAVYVIVWEKKSNFSGILKTQIKISGVNKKTLKNLHHFDYLFWIHLIKEKYASNSPVFLVQNKIELEDNEEVSVREGLLNKYETIFDHAISIAKAHEYIKSNKPKDRQFFLKYEIFKEELVKTLQLVSQKKQIQQYIINIRNEVINISKSNNYISYTVFSELCEAILKENYNSEKTKIAIQYLHEAGIILYYGFVEHNYNFLDDIVFLNPTFVSKTIYKILDIRVQSNWGKFNYNHVLSVLKSEKLTKVFIELMQAPYFELIFKYPYNEDTYFAPQYMEEEYSGDSILFEMIKSQFQTSLVLKYNNYFSNTIISRFMTRFGGYSEKEIFWKYGILLNKNQKSFLVECVPDEKKIFIKTLASNSRNLIVKEIFDSLYELSDNDDTIEISTDNKIFDQINLVKRYELQKFSFLFKNMNLGSSYINYEDKQIMLNGYDIIISGLKEKKIVIKNNNSALLKELKSQLIKEDYKNSEFYAKFDLLIEKLENINNIIHDNETLNEIVNSVNQLKIGQNRIESKLDEHYNYLMEFEQNLDNKEAIKTITEDIINSKSIESANRIIGFILDSYSILEEMIDDKLDLVISEIKKTENWETKVKLGIPILNLIGVNIEHEYKLNDFIKKFF